MAQEKNKVDIKVADLRDNTVIKYIAYKETRTGKGKRMRQLMVGNEMPKDREMKDIVGNRNLLEELIRSWSGNEEREGSRPPFIVWDSSTYIDSSTNTENCQSAS